MQAVCCGSGLKNMLMMGTLFTLIFKREQLYQAEMVLISLYCFNQPVIFNLAWPEFKPKKLKLEGFDHNIKPESVQTA